jgi:hypothetical protein
VSTTHCLLYTVAHCLLPTAHYHYSVSTANQLHSRYCVQCKYKLFILQAVALLKNLRYHGYTAYTGDSLTLASKQRALGSKQWTEGIGQWTEDSWAVDSKQWEGSGQWAVGCKQRAGSGQWTLNSAQWTMDSGRRTVGRGQWAHWNGSLPVFSQSSTGI